MPRVLTAAAAAAVLGLGLHGAASAAERVIIIDAPDVQRLNPSTDGFLTSDVIGTDVYGNARRRIGEIEDFMMRRDGQLYAVIDIDDGPIERYVELGDGDRVVVPWHQLRIADRPQ